MLMYEPDLIMLKQKRWLFLIKALEMNGLSLSSFVLNRLFYKAGYILHFNSFIVSKSFEKKSKTELYRVVCVS